MSKVNYPRLKVRFEWEDGHSVVRGVTETTRGIRHKLARPTKATVYNEVDDLVVLSAKDALRLREKLYKEILCTLRPLSSEFILDDSVSTLKGDEYEEA